MDFESKIVLITGASSGIGAATAFHFSKLNATLVLVGRNTSNLNRMAVYCEKLSPKKVKPLQITADLTIEDDVGRIVKETVDSFGGIDVLVNNAGVTALGGIKNTNMDDFDKIMNINMRAIYQLTMLAVPCLIERKGCIINVSSTASMKPSTTHLAYSLSKAALDQFTKCLALELAENGVRVNAVNPGFVNANSLKNNGLSEEQIEHYVQNMSKKSPLKRTVDADEVASMIAYLASDKAKSITGILSVIDSGHVLS